MQTLLRRLLPAALLVASACGAPDPSACDAANQRIRDCFGVDFEECDDASAKRILAAPSCDAITAAADVDGKKDGGYCPRFLWWICGDDVEATCAAAGDGSRYASMTNSEKLDYHWQWGLCTEYGAPGNEDMAKGWQLLKDAAVGIGSSLLRLERAFTNSTDELDRGRKKLLHPYGSLVQVRFDRAPTDDSCHTEYTGLWSADSLVALARLGWGQDPKALGYVPGVALKFFIAGRSSVNLHLIPSLQGGEDPNYFAQAPTNVLPSPMAGAIKALVKYFKLFADQPLRLQLDHVAKVYADGTTLAASDAVAPYQIVLEPTAQARQLYQAELDLQPGVDFRVALEAIPSGTPLYDVLVTASATGCKERLGRLTTSSEFRASQWGDEKLYFQHAKEGQGL